MIAAVLLYGLVADPKTITEQAGEVASALPQNAGSLVIAQMRNLAKAPEHSLSLGLLISLVLALWSASGGVGNVITALNLAYDEKETRGFVKRKALALGLTLGAIVFVVLAIALVAAVPAILDAFVPAGPLYWLLEGLRWALLVAIVACVLAVLYHVAPDRAAPKFRWMSFGAVVATIIWILASVGFSVYVNTFGSYGRTYGGGVVTSVVVLMLWLWITNLIVLFGAEINAEAESATADAG
jgi:membrane protein